MKRVFYTQQESKQHLGTQVPLNLLHIYLLKKRSFRSSSSVRALNRHIQNSNPILIPHKLHRVLFLLIWESSKIFTAIMVMFAMCEVQITKGTQCI
jgi:hypothetical protein